MTEIELREIVFRGVESDELDYKAHQSWNTMTRAAKGRIVRHLTALANTKGGYVVIGVGEDEAGFPSDYTGLTPEESHSFDPTAVGNFVAACIEPPVDFTIERPVIDGKRYAVFIVKPFRNLPHVCGRGVEGELQTGVFYIRTEAAASRPACRAIEMQALIQRSLRNQRELLGRMLRGILYENRSAVSEPAAALDDNAASATEYFRHRRPRPDTGAVLMQITLRPESGKAGRFDLEVLRAAALDAWRLRPGPRLIADGELGKVRRTSVSLRMLSPNEPRMWQIFDSGLFHCVGWLPAPGNALDFNLLRKLATEAAGFSGRFYSTLDLSEELIDFELRLDDVSGCRLYAAGFPENCVCRAPHVEVELRRSVADLAAGGTAHAGRLLRRAAEAFAVPDKALGAIEVSVASERES